MNTATWPVRFGAITVGMSFGSVAGAVAARLGAALGCEARVTGTEAETAWISNAGRSFQLWGYPEVSLDQMIEWTAAWLRQGGQTLNKPTHFEARDGKY